MGKALCADPARAHTPLTGHLMRVAGFLSSRRYSRWLKAWDAPVGAPRPQPEAEGGAGQRAEGRARDRVKQPQQRVDITGQLTLQALQQSRLQSLSPWMGAGSVLRMSLASWLKLLLMKGGRPVAHSYSTHPRDHRSLAVEWGAPSLNSSGAM